MRLLLSDPASDAGMSPDLARVRAEQKPSREKYLAKLGPVQSYTFAGVSRFGSDTYTVKHQNGSETVMLVVAKDGTLAMAYRHPWPMQRSG